MLHRIYPTDERKAELQAKAARAGREFVDEIALTLPPPWSAEQRQVLRAAAECFAREQMAPLLGIRGMSDLIEAILASAIAGIDGRLDEVEAHFITGGSA